MRPRQYICISLINLGFLVSGMALDRMLRSDSVYAQAIAQAAPSQEFEEITPIMTVGSAGIGTLLANRVAADQMMVNGYDVLKLDEGILQLIQRKTSAQNAELQSVVDSAKVSRPLRVKLPNPAPNRPAPGKGAGR